MAGLDDSLEDFVVESRVLRTGPLFDNVEPERRNMKMKLAADLADGASPIAT